MAKVRIVRQAGDFQFVPSMVTVDPMTNPHILFDTSYPGSRKTKQELKICL
jgi:hypothetical protein